MWWGYLIYRSTYSSVSLSEHVHFHNGVWFGGILVLFICAHFGTWLGPVWPGPDRKLSAKPLLSPHGTAYLGRVGEFFSLYLIFLFPSCSYLSFYLTFLTYINFHTWFNPDIITSSSVYQSENIQKILRAFITFHLVLRQSIW